MMDVFGQPDLLVAGFVVLAALAFVAWEVVVRALRAVGRDLWQWAKRCGGHSTDTGARERGITCSEVDGTSGGGARNRMVLHWADLDE